ncbi:hypothetical protein An12g05350 [Aspergillus niger]|uniref:Uncharacterized protein n=2 Tax=Aspergillus niger TaxID=5061 RepID=A2QZL5_ASPNC|nr:hypothetical protein An12g05350 [Aspergillus niger]CAK46247.1 hypothetical protein An12g05350 [Aspergillus niger]
MGLNTTLTCIHDSPSLVDDQTEDDALGAVQSGSHRRLAAAMHSLKAVAPARYRIYMSTGQIHSTFEGSTCPKSIRACCIEVGSQPQRVSTYGETRLSMATPHQAILESPNDGATLTLVLSRNSGKTNGRGSTRQTPRAGGTCLRPSERPEDHPDPTINWALSSALKPYTILSLSASVIERTGFGNPGLDVGRRRRTILSCHLRHGDINEAPLRNNDGCLFEITNTGALKNTVFSVSQAILAAHVGRKREICGHWGQYHFSASRSALWFPRGGGGGAAAEPPLAANAATIASSSLVSTFVDGDVPLPTSRPRSPLALKQSRETMIHLSGPPSQPAVFRIGKFSVSIGVVRIRGNGTPGTVVKRSGVISSEDGNVPCTELEIELGLPEDARLGKGVTGE